MSRFAIREATRADTAGIARVSVASWQASYRGILPDEVLAKMDLGRRTQERERLMQAPSGLHLVAYDVSHGDIVGFCDAGPSRNEPNYPGEVYAIYFEHHAKRFGLGSEMFERVFHWLGTNQMRSMIVWVLANNPHARRFYEAQGGRVGHTKQSQVSGHTVTEQAYLWDRI